MVQRMCQECGETWTLEAAVAHLGTRGLRGFSLTRRARRSTVRGVLGSTVRGLPADYLADTYAELDHQSEMITQTRTCPKCGSMHFKDKRA